MRKLEGTNLAFCNSQRLMGLKDCGTTCECGHHCMCCLGCCCPTRKLFVEDKGEKVGLGCRLTEKLPVTTEPMISIENQGVSLVDIGYDGTVIIHNPGADKEAAKTFYEALAIEGVTWCQKASDKAVDEYKERVRKAWKDCRERANKDYSYGDADNAQIAFFDEWLKKEFYQANILFVDATDDRVGTGTVMVKLKKRTASERADYLQEKMTEKTIELINYKKRVKKEVMKAKGAVDDTYGTDHPAMITLLKELRR